MAKCEISSFGSQRRSDPEVGPFQHSALMIFLCSLNIILPRIKNDVGQQSVNRRLCGLQLGTKGFTGPMTTQHFSTFFNNFHVFQKSWDHTVSNVTQLGISSISSLSSLVFKWCGDVEISPTTSIQSMTNITNITNAAKHEAHKCFLSPSPTHLKRTSTRNKQQLHYLQTSGFQDPMLLCHELYIPQYFYG